MVDMDIKSFSGLNSQKYPKSLPTGGRGAGEYFSGFNPEKIPAAVSQPKVMVDREFWLGT